MTANDNAAPVQPFRKIAMYRRASAAMPPMTEEERAASAQEIREAASIRRQRFEERLAAARSDLSM